MFCVATIRQRPYGPGAVDVDELGVVDKQLGQAVNHMKLEGEFNKLVLIADSQTLGQFREVMHKAVEASLVLTVAKDLTNHPANEITKVLLAAKAPEKAA